MKCVKMADVRTLIFHGQVIRVSDKEADKLVRVYGFADRYATKKEWKEGGRIVKK